MQQFDPNLRPSKVNFHKMAVWIRIHDLPFVLMKNKWGWKLGKKVGSVMKVDVDSQGRAWGAYLRAKVQIDLNKPLSMMCHNFSKKRQTTKHFEVSYEKIPKF